MIIFQNPQFGEIRTAGTADNPMFCLADVCNAIGINNSRAVKNRLEDDDVSLIDTIDNLGRTQQVTFVTESGLYDVIIRSDSEQAKPFRKWVTSEVLPSIRKHGAYMTERTIEKALSEPDFLIRLATQLKEERQMRMEAEKSRAEEERRRLEAEQVAIEQKQVIEEQAPKVVFADAIIGSKSSCLIGELAKILTMNGYKIGQNRLFQLLREQHYLGSRGEYYNIPCQQYIEQGLFELKKTTHSENGVMKTSVTPKVTGKGQHYFINKFVGMGTLM